jgi:predicted dehydrogenase
MTKFRIGIIGTGNIVKWLQIPGIIRSPDLELTALCDINEDAMEQIANDNSIDKSFCFTDYNDLINCDDVDAVIISTTNDMHFPVAMAAVKAGKPYLLEKPITINIQQANELKEATLSKNLKNMICFSKRFLGAARYARELVQSGKIGKVYHINVQYFHSWALTSRKVGMVWRFDKNKAGAGCLFDLGSHCIDYVRFITGEEFLYVSALLDTFVKTRPCKDGSTGTVDVDDYCIFHATLSSGGSANIHVSNVAYGRNDYQRIEVYGSEGSLVYLNNAEDGSEDEIHICIGEDYANGRVFSKIPIPQKYKADLMQGFADILNDCGDGLSATIVDGQINQHILENVLTSAKLKKSVII